MLWKSAVVCGMFIGGLAFALNRWEEESAAGARDDPAITHIEEVEEFVWAMTNEIRRRQGLPPTLREPTLRDIARGHSDDMIRRHFFEHVNPDGHDSAYRIAEAHRQLIGGSGENIWRYATSIEYDDGRRVPAYIDWSPRKIAEQAVESWMNSPGHRANILRPSFTHLGVGMSIVKGEVTITQNFASVRGYLKTGLPRRIGQGGYVSLESTPFPASAPNAAKYDFWKEKQEETEGSPLPLSATRIDVRKGLYRMRFYYPVPDGYEIYMGPRIEVR